ncbi:MAG: hypothetical protein DCC68_25870 [Planctomycetota bacterium]|nr:MAG: hypothetical protein DCC68_25870 [Planctomycetota bacterium]
MGYRDELIRRLKAEGAWEQLRENDRIWIESISDDVAREYMAFQDQIEIRDPAAVGTVMHRVTRILHELFRHSVFETNDEGVIELSSIGGTLAAVIAELQAVGVSEDEIGEAFATLKVATIDRYRNGDLEGVSSLFLGKLVEYDDDNELKISPIGTKLNLLLRALQAALLTDQEIEEDFCKLNSLVVILFSAYHGGKSSSES